MKTIQQKLKETKDILGWRPPYHYHFKTIQNGVDRPWDVNLPPIYSVNCMATECEAPGCPRTESGKREETNAKD